MPHPADVYYSLKTLLQKEVYDFEGKYPWCTKSHTIKQIKYWTRRWKNHVKKHGHVPLVLKCKICSGKERREDIKKGIWKVSTREEQKELKKEIED